MSRIAWILAALLLAFPAGAAPACDIPTEYLTVPRPLFATARALRSETLRILVLGSGSVTGSGASAPEGAWPTRLQNLLALQYPERAVEVAVRGGRGINVNDHLALLRDPPAGQEPALVLWQAGTVEAVRGMDPDEMTDAMLAGLERIRGWGADTILIDQQFSRFLRANTNIEPYREKLRLIAAAAGAPVFRRYDLMQHWVETGAIDLERTPRPEMAATIDRLNDCLARAMAALIIQGVSEAR
ncbi:SGNH/GDSL hydrolase family protein [Roseococcus sp. SYP-B2431]|uniref:SGNH/GDSL hydrolase family protein n=1 Tax=Roseococcus sp. SYP-B2431 TaxID=2496640 RepID=UPI00103BC54A|nr:SGNH/GDSL hydrolase family protein [Roseococcus sp. SYP-B2431]TCH97651.1 SGNH/GDSL hydrolase family protein [Roseococcus sp. SYP-B2431]